MAAAGAPLGNQNAAKGRRWADAINRALEFRSRGKQTEEINDLANKLLDLCAEGDLAALKELGDRLDGKPHQSSDMTLSGDLTIRPIDYSQAKEGA